MNPRSTDLPVPVEFWYDFASNYSYLAAMRIGALAEKFQVSVIWRPFLLGPIFKSFGWDNSPFVLQQEKGAYVWKDMDRQCSKYGLQFQKPSNFPRNSVLATRVAMLAQDSQWIATFSKEILHLNFAEDEDISDPDLIAAVLADLNLDAASLLAAAETDDNRKILREQVSAARQLGVFGAPMFLVQGEMFWGNDRLEDALIFAATFQENAHSNPRK
jgi:2-hydroxychromene-2-carboxylate isomerase